MGYKIVGILWLDTETYSEVPIKWGTYRYVENCECMLVTYAYDDGPVQVWDRTDPLSYPDTVLDELRNPEVQIRIHNVPFDRGVLRHALGIDLPIERFYDTSIQARAHALPGSLGPLCEALGLGEDKAKIKAGKALIQLFCKPRPKNSKLRRATRETHPEEWARFIEYAKQDIVAMRAASKKMPTWNYSAKSPEMALWYLDQKINDRGIYVDLDLANAAIRAVSREKERLSGEMQELTGYDEETGEGVRSATERDTFLEYIFEAFGVSLPDLQKATLAKCLEDDDIPAPVKELIENRLDASSTAARKYNAVINAASPDGRVRGTLQFDGAGRTRRWAGRTIQPQNMFKSKLKQKELDAGIELLKFDVADLMCDDVTTLCASAVRGFIIAPPGKKLVVSDLANIEGRGLAWLADERWKLQAFRDFDAGTGWDLYVLAYARAFRVPPEDVTDLMRQIGKVMELALGYAGGVGAFVTFAAAYGIDLDVLAAQVYDTLPDAARAEAADFHKWMTEQGNNTYGMKRETYIMCETFKRLWRQAHFATAPLWKELEQTVKSAIYKPGFTFPCRKFNVRRDGAWLRIGLPSGRALCYPHPEVSSKGAVSYMGQDQYTRKWQRILTHGGKLIENATQSIARDALADSMPAIEDAGYEIILTAHDEPVTETPDDPAFTAKGLSKILAVPQSWAPDMPLAAKGFEAYRYRKG